MQVSVINESTTVVVSDSQTSTEVGGERVILDLDRGVYYGLNTVGARIWEMMESPVTVDEIIETLLDEFEDVSREQCREDVARLLEELKEQRLIRVNGEISE